MRRFTIISVVCSVALLSLVTGAARAADNIDGGQSPTAPAANQPTERFIRTFRGVEHYTLSTPLDQRSDALRHYDGKTNPDGTPRQPSSGFIFASQVIVRTDMPDAAAQLGKFARATDVTSIDAAPGFWSVSAANVWEAADLADDLAADGRFAEVYIDHQDQIGDRTPPTDPRYASNQWTLSNPVNPLFDVNIEPAWDMGYTGQGVIVGISETGRFQNDHVDLAANFLSTASQASSAAPGNHATSVAGIVGMVANNGLNGAGAAYNAKISQQIVGSSQQQADAIGFRNDLNMVKNNSWGPFDDLQFRSLPSVVAAALETGVNTGRGGLGEIYVWAAGNGGASNDRTDYDPYVSSRFAICVGAIGDADTRSINNETGSSMFVVTQTDGNLRKVYSLLPNNGETTVFGGTSASAPLATGVVALVLQANPSLTWRDVQHVLMRTTRRNDASNAEWIQNGAGHWVNYNYGYGAIDATAAVIAALGWHNVPALMSIDTGVVTVNQDIPDAPVGANPGVSIDIPVTGNIRVEAVELFLNATTTSIGNLRVVLTSPAGVDSLLAVPRTVDTQDNFTNALFTSRRHWDEPSIGTWRVRIADEIAGTQAQWQDARIRIWGSAICNGDVNGDRVIDLTDLATALSSFGLCNPAPGYLPYADFDGDRCVTLTDLALLLQNFGGNCPN